MKTLQARAKAILLTPRTEWEVIAREPADVKSLFARYVATLALVPAIAGLIGSTLIGGYASVLSGLLGAVVGYVLTFLVVFAMALIVDALAPTFGAQRSFSNALKLTVYSYTPVWLAGLFMLVPGLSFLTILGLYGLYLLWLGLPPLMAAPFDKSVPYAVTAVICAVVLAAALGFIHAVVSG
jgi:hypothetical protein